MFIVLYWRPDTVWAVLEMGQDCAEWDHSSAGNTGARTDDKPPDALLLMLLDLVKGEQHIAALEPALMQSILDHGESKQALAFSHWHPACGALHVSLPARVLVYLYLFI